MASKDHHDIDVDTIIKEWAAGKIPDIIKIFGQKGGWEGWAQAEIASFLHDHHEDKVEREVPVYPATKTANDNNSQLRADIVVDLKDASGKNFIIIELKCEGAANKDAFPAAIKKDIAKVHGEIKDDYKPARAWVMGFSTSEDIFDKMTKANPQATNIELYPTAAGGPDITLTPKQAELKPKIALWIFEKDIVIGAPSASSLGKRSADEDAAGGSATNKAKGAGGKAKPSGQGFLASRPANGAKKGEEDEDKDGEEADKDEEAEDAEEDEDGEAEEDGEEGEEEGDEEDEEDEEEEDS